MSDIKELEPGVWKSSRLYFLDKGPVSKGAKTRLFNVLSSHTRVLLGTIKWYVHWRKYVFCPINSLFDDNCLAEIADFLDERTSAHMSRLPKIKRAKQLMLKRRERRIKRLTEEKERSRIALLSKQKGSCIPQMQVVEGGGLAPEVQEKQ